MMRAVDTLLARVLLVSLLGITVFHLLSLWTYEHTLNAELTQAREEQIVDRLLSIKRSVAAVSEGQREALAHDLSGGPVQAHWGPSRGAAGGGPGAQVWSTLTGLLMARSQLTSSDVVLGTGGDAHVALLSLRLPDDSWLNVTLFATDSAKASNSGHFLSTSLMALGVALLSVLMTTWLTWPLRQISEAVSALSIDERRKLIPETGPREVRHLAASFNVMHERLIDLIQRRTQSLAAVSHDLRTPLTRLKLRAGDIRDADLQRAVAADVEEMEQMIEATLSYLKGRETTEPARPVDLVALLETIVDDAADAGRDATIDAPESAVILARHMGMKRALSNLISNALRYADKVRVRIAKQQDVVLVTIEDDGPGIPDDMLEAVFEPFMRVDGSRNTETGGVGLGLTIAKTNIEADGGTLVLHNRPQGGLRATIQLPLAQAGYGVPVAKTS